MKRIVLIFIGLFLFFVSPVFSQEENADSELKLKQAQLSAVEWEFRYCNERMQNLNSQAQMLQKEIEALKVENKNKKEIENRETR